MTEREEREREREREKERERERERRACEKRERERIAKDTVKERMQRFCSMVVSNSLSLWDQKTKFFANEKEPILIMPYVESASPVHASVRNDVEGLALHANTVQVLQTTLQSTRTYA